MFFQINKCIRKFGIIPKIQKKDKSNRDGNKIEKCALKAKTDVRFYNLAKRQTRNADQTKMINADKTEN